MSDPTPADNQPVVARLKAGDHWWCACGRSQVRPFCDGSHKGSGIAPVRFTVEEEKPVVLCNCRRTGNPPYCDGSHSLPPAS